MEKNREEGIVKFIDNFIEENGKVCWESSYENGKMCISEDKFRAYAKKCELRIKDLMSENHILTSGLAKKINEVTPTNTVEKNNKRFPRPKPSIKEEAGDKLLEIIEKKLRGNEIDSSIKEGQWTTEEGADHSGWIFTGKWVQLKSTSCTKEYAERILKQLNATETN